MEKKPDRVKLIELFNQIKEKARIADKSLRETAKQDLTNEKGERLDFGDIGNIPENGLHIYQLCALFAILF